MEGLCEVFVKKIYLYSPLTLPRLGARLRL